MTIFMSMPAGSVRPRRVPMNVARVIPNGFPITRPAAYGGGDGLMWRIAL